MLIIPKKAEAKSQMDDILPLEATRYEWAAYLSALNAVCSNTHKIHGGGIRR